MSYAAIIDGISAAFARVEGLPEVDSQGLVINIMPHEPQSIHGPRLMYSLLESFEREYDETGEVVMITYQILHRLLLRWQDPAQAEQELMAFVNSIPAAVEADPHLRGALAHGYAYITSGEADWASINGVECRSLDFHSRVTETVRYQGGW